MSERKRQLLLAGLGGVAGTSVDVCVLATLVESGAPIALAALLGSLAGAVGCFVINKYVAFRERGPLQLRQLTTFALVAGATAVLMAGAMFVACDLGHVPYLLAKAVCAVVVFLLWSYPAQRRLVFVSS